MLEYPLHIRLDGPSRSAAAVSVNHLCHGIARGLCIAQTLIEPGARHIHRGAAAFDVDNLTSCQSCLNAIMDTEALSDICNLVVLFDNEECGSSSKQGAGSVILSSILEKIYLNTPDTDKSRTAFIDVMLHSLTASLDVAHAMHPNHPEKNDPTNPIPMEGGVVIKMNYNQRYATDTNAVSIVEGICRAEKIAHTKFVNHGDAVGGGTLGSILSTSIPAMTVDLGVPILAMHSSRELMARSSQLAMDQFAEAFFK